MRVILFIIVKNYLLVNLWNLNKWSIEPKTIFIIVKFKSYKQLSF